MAILVRIPTPLQKFTKNQSEVRAEGATVQAVLEHLDHSFPGIRERLCDEHGAVRRFINLYLNDEDIRFLEGEKTVLKDGDELAIIPAIAGGTRDDGAIHW
jgi:molybdopterin synthase sulfur carrier subunit